MFETITPQAALQRELAGATLVDVREPDEYAAGHAAGAVNIPLGEVAEHAAELSVHDDVLFICRSGGRSAQACSISEPAGVKATNVAGGTEAWYEAGLPFDS